MLADKYNQIVTALMETKSFVPDKLTCNAVNVCQWVIKNDTKDLCSFYIRKATSESLQQEKPLSVLLDIYRETNSEVGYYVQALLLSKIEVDDDFKFININTIKGDSHISVITTFEIEGTLHETHLRIEK